MKEIRNLLDALANQRKLVDRLKADAETTAQTVKDHENRIARAKQSIRIATGVIIASKTRINALEEMRKNARYERAKHAFSVELFKNRQPPQEYTDYVRLVESISQASSGDKMYLAMEAQDMRSNPAVGEWLDAIANNEQRKNALIGCDKAIKDYDCAIVQSHLTAKTEIAKQHKAHKLIIALEKLLVTDTKVSKVCRANWVEANKTLIKLESESQIAKHALQSDQTSLEAFLKAQSNRNKSRAGHANKKAQKALSDKAKKQTCTVWIKSPANPLDMDSIDKNARVPYQRLGEIPLTKTEKAKQPRGAKLKRFI